MKSSTHCQNCHHPLPEEASFCSNCGQSAHIHRIDMHFIIHEVIHAFTHTDKGILYLTKELATRPGIVIKEYIEGKRKRYFNPFSYLVITVAISAFLVHNFNLLSFETNQTNPATAFATKYVNWIFFFGVPISSFFAWLLFRKKGYNYAETLTFHAFTGGFRIVFFLLIFTPLVIFFREHYFTMLGIYLVAWGIFLCWAKLQFYGGPRWLTILKSILVLLFTQLSTTLAVSLIIYTKYRFHW